MTQFALKSIHPVNLLSFGPETEPIEIRPLNILIGANGSGKSNLIEAVRLLHFLPDKDPWAIVKATGGVGEWVWKGESSTQCSMGARFSIGNSYQATRGIPIEYLNFQVELEISGASFRVKGESIRLYEDVAKTSHRYQFTRTGSEGGIGPSVGSPFSHEPPAFFSLAPERSVLSQLASGAVLASSLGSRMSETYGLAEYLQGFDFHQDWEFGANCPPRNPQPVGQPVDRLREDASNLAQMLAYYRDNHRDSFSTLTECVARFYGPAKSVEIPILSTHLQIAVREQNGRTTPATRLSDGMLRWLSLLAILLNPTPAPVTCIDEPELGLHPDILPTLADLLRDASTRTQLIVTTHSASLIDAFSRPEDAESVCVTEKVEGSTVIRRLKADELAVWLEEYSLGSLWTSGQIGGNRW